MTRTIFNEDVLSSWKGIDPENWQRMAGEIVETFFATCPRQYGLLCDAWKIRDFETVRRLAHSLKSSCGNVGAERAHDLFELIEKAAELKDIERLVWMIEELQLVFIEGNLKVLEFINKIQAT